MDEQLDFPQIQFLQLLFGCSFQIHKKVCSHGWATRLSVNTSSATGTIRVKICNYFLVALFRSTKKWLVMDEQLDPRWIRFLPFQQSAAIRYNKRISSNKRTLDTSAHCPDSSSDTIDCHFILSSHTIDFLLLLFRDEIVHPPIPFIISQDCQTIHSTTFPVSELVSDQPFPLNATSERASWMENVHVVTPDITLEDNHWRQTW